MNAPRYFAAFTSIGALEAERAAWQALAREALEPNPFYEADFLLASERHLRAGRPITCLIVRDRARANQLCGLFPLERPFLRDGLFRFCWSLYRNPYICITTPLLAADNAGAILSTALDFLRQAPGPNRLFLPLSLTNRPFCRLLGASEGPLPHLRAIDAYARAAILPQAAAQTYRATRWKSALRRQIRRRFKRLSEQGTVTLRRIESTTPEGKAALRAFLALEAASWKGEMGTALACRPATRAFAEMALASPEAAPASVIELLELDGKPIAINVNLVAHGAGFSIKTAYDPAFARFSPGILLDSKAIDMICDEKTLDRLDSCAAAGHPIEALWADEEPVAQLMLALSPSPSPIGLAWLSGWLRLVGQMRSLRHASAYTSRPGIG